MPEQTKQMQDNKIMTKDKGLFLIVGDNEQELKHVFYRAYFTEQDIYDALGKDEELKHMIKELKPLDLVIITLTEGEGIIK